MKICENCGAEFADEETMCPVCAIPAEEIEEDLPAAEPAEEVSEDEPEGIGDEAPEEPGKNRWTGVATAIVVVTALIILGLIGMILYHEGTLQVWWAKIKPKTKSVCTINDYSEIQVLKSAIDFDDATVEDYVMQMTGGELTDEAAIAYASAHKDCNATTIDELRQYAHDFIYTYLLHNEMMTYLKGNTTVNSYDEVMEAELIAYTAADLEYTASTYGMDPDTVASYYGYESAIAYETAAAHDYQEIEMILDTIMKDKGISYTDEELDADIDTYLSENGYYDYYTKDEFLDMAGETWVYLYENLTFKFNKVMDALEPNVVFIDEPAE